MTPVKHRVLPCSVASPSLNLAGMRRHGTWKNCLKEKIFHNLHEFWFYVCFQGCKYQRLVSCLCCLCLWFWIWCEPGQAEGYDMTQPSLREALEDQIHSQKKPRKQSRWEFIRFVAWSKSAFCQGEVDFWKGIYFGSSREFHGGRAPEKRRCWCWVSRHSKGAWIVCSNADFSLLFAGPLGFGRTT